jgi:hypothetical protein
MSILNKYRTKFEDWTLFTRRETNLLFKAIFSIFILKIFFDHISIIIHEGWHVLIAMFFNVKVTEINVNLDTGTGFVNLVFPRALNAMSFEAGCIALVGGLSTAIIYLAIGYGWFKPIMLLALTDITYAIWEVFYLASSTWQVWVSKISLLSMVDGMTFMFNFISVLLFFVAACPFLFKEYKVLLS